MFRTVPMKFRLNFAAFISIFTVSVMACMSVYSLWQSELELERQIHITNVLKQEMTVDMMHDAVEAGVVYALLLGEGAEPEKRTKIEAKMAEDAARFREAIKNLHDLELPPEAWDELGRAGAPVEPGGDPFGWRDALTHPQYHLKLLLQRMGIGREEARQWHRKGITAAPPARSRAISARAAAGLRTLAPAMKKRKRSRPPAAQSRARCVQWSSAAAS